MQRVNSAMEGPSEPSTIPDLEDNDSTLANSVLLTRKEVLKRRYRLLRRLVNCYKDYYWSLMEDLRRKHRDYLWKYGSPFKEDSDGERENGSLNIGNHNANCGSFVSNSGNLGLGLGGSSKSCCFPGCKTKAMALTRHCLQHILSDSKQNLYKGCRFIKSSRGSSLCGKPILRSTIPSLCPDHLQKAEKQISLALKKSGVSPALSTKLAPKFHRVINEYIRLIQSRRRAAANGNIDKLATNNATT